MNALKPFDQIASQYGRVVIPKARLTPTPVGARSAQWYRPPAPRVRPPIRVRAAQEAARLRKRGLYVGRDRETGLHQYMDPAFLATHMVVLGRTGVGKTMFLAWLFRLLAQQHDHTIIVLDPKGDLYDLTKRVAIADGLTKRVVCFDPADPDCAGFNPLKPNGLPEFTHAKAVREAIRSAWGQADFFQTPQLARFLFLALAVARLMEFDLVQALQVLVPGEQGSTLRKSVLPKLADPFIQASLQYLDGLPERRQEELVAPCLARLEAFCLDPMIRGLLTGRTRVLDIAEVIERRQICLVNLSKYQPLRKDDVGLLGKLLVNDILVKVFERPKEKRTPVIFIADEIQNFATFDFCDILDEGRGLMLWCILAHQHLAQLMDEEKSGYLHHSIMADARTKILFNALPEDVEALSKQVFLDGRWHPFMMKDELDALEQQFLEERRVSVSAGKSGSQGRGVSWTEGGSIADSVAHTQGSSRTVTEGTSEAWSDGVTRSVALSLTETEGSSRTHGVTDTDTQGTAHTELTSDTTMSMRGHAEGFMQGHSAGTSEGENRGMSRSYDYMAIIPNTIDRSSGQSSGSSASDSEAESTMDSQVSSTGTTLTSGDTDSCSHAHSVSDSESQSHARSRGITQGLARTNSYTYGVNASVAETASKSVTTGRTQTSSQSVTESRSEEEGWNAGQTLSPFLAPYARRVPTSRTYLTWEEHTLICTALASGQDKGQCMLKLPLKPLLFLDAPWWEAPFVTRRMLARANERIRDNIPVEVLPPAADADHAAVIDVTPVPVPAIPMEASPVNVAPETYDRSRFRRPRTPSA